MVFNSFAEAVVGREIIDCVLEAVVEGFGGLFGDYVEASEFENFFSPERL